MHRSEQRYYKETNEATQRQQKQTKSIQVLLLFFRKWPYVLLLLLLLPLPVHLIDTLMGVAHQTTHYQRRFKMLSANKRHCFYRVLMEVEKKHTDNNEKKEVSAK